MSEGKKKNKIFSEWLEQLQQESWQLELLISGLALFGIWESKSGFLKLQHYLDSNITSTYAGFTEPLMAVFWAGWYIFMINLLIHIILRGLWIGAIGLRYVSGDINYDKLNYSDIFTNFFKKRIGGFDSYIERLEKLSSVIFSFTFLLFLMLFSFVFLNLVFGLISSIIWNVFYPELNSAPPVILIFGATFYGIGLLVLIDFLTLGGFKRVKDPTFSKIYYWIYRIFSILSISAIYRPLLLNFIDNKYTRRIFFLAFPYVITIIIGVGFTSFEKYSFIPSLDQNNYDYNYIVDAQSINWNNYDDLRTNYHETYSDEDRPLERSTIKVASLNQYEINSSYGKIFLKYLRRDNDLLARQHPEFASFKNIGLNHRLFYNGLKEDPEEEMLKKQELREIKLMLKVVREQGDAIDSSEMKEFGHIMDRYQGKEKKDIQSLRTDITDKYSILKETRAQQRVESALHIILNNYSISIDDVPYIDSLQCSFFTHPNMHERGLLCYFPTKTLDIGPHLLHLRKIYNRNDCIEDCPELIKNIPFRKVD